MNKVLQQDDAAPDSLKYFEREFKSIIGMDVADFKMGANHVTAKLGHTDWINGDFKLSISADDPFYSLHVDDKNLLTHVTQTSPVNCVSACLAMITGSNIDDIAENFHEDYRAGKLNVRDFLTQYSIPYKRLLAEQRRPKQDKIYIAAVPSLNIPGALHQVVIETTITGQGWWIYDPNLGRDGVEHYTADTMGSYILEYAIPRSWVRGGRRS